MSETVTPVPWKIGLYKDKDKDRIFVDFPYNEEVKDALKANIQGLRWSPVDRLWHAPLDLDTAKDIRSICQRFNATLNIEPTLAAWVRVEKDRYANLLKPDDISVDASQWFPRLRNERPELIKAMESKPWQLPGAAFMVGQKATLLADQPGLGKTIQTLATIAELDLRGPILVVAPRTAVNVTWPEEIAQWLGTDELVFTISGALKPDERAANLKEVARLARNTDKRIWVLCGPNYLRIKADLDGNGNYLRDSNGKKIIRALNEGRPELFTIKWSAVIVDESHQTLAGATGNKKKQSAQRVGLGALDIKRNGLLIAISGTPFRGKTENLWGTLNWLYPNKYTSYWAWIRRHYGINRNANARFGSGISKGDRIIDEKRFFGELKPIMVRRTKKEVAPSLPPKTYGGTHLDPNDLGSPVAVWLPMSEQQSKQYNEIVDKALITIDEMGETINVNGVLAEMVRMKQVANSGFGYMSNGNLGPVLPSNKVEWIEQFLDERISAGTKTIIASQFTGFINMLSDHLNDRNITHYKLTGATNDNQRAYIKSEFQKDEGEMVILLNTKAGGVSLTLDAADDVVICDQTWIPDDQEQVEDRAHRVSRDHNVTVWYLASLGTIDQDVAITNAAREDAIMGILDRSRGVSYVKALIAATKKRQNKKAA